MIALDTNVLVRWVTRDDERQANIADEVIGRNASVSLTVLVELSWVLTGKHYRFDASMLARTLGDIADSARIALEDEHGARWAISRLSEGADFADMIHLIAARGSEAFATFDTRLSAKAGSTTPLPIDQLR